jgi:hypothetical protein
VLLLSEQGCRGLAGGLPGEVEELAQGPLLRADRFGGQAFRNHLRQDRGENVCRGGLVADVQGAGRIPKSNPYVLAVWSYRSLVYYLIGVRVS